jgi:NADH:ubiquinone oxidoreductase subunit F (NADH-binding)
MGPLAYRGAAGLLIEEVEAAGLTGRGGAAFPTAVKMAAVAAASDRQAVVVANGAEGEPASAKDKRLLWQSPHLVLDGLQLAAEAVGAGRAVVYLHRDDRLLRRAREAIAERSAARSDRVPVEIVTAPGRFLAGEESALASKVSGGLALPRFTPPRVFERGVAGAPTLVQNVETLAHLALIARHGPAWFRAAGTPAEPGTMLATCHQADGRTWVSEVEIGAPLGSVLDLASSPAQAVLTGGYHGAWISAAHAATLPLANASLRAAGGVLGAGVLAALPAGRCGLAEAARVVRYLAAESARQCGPCLAGLPRIADALSHLARPYPDPRLLDHLRRWTGLVAGRGACRHPDGTVRFVRSALTVFAPEIAAHSGGLCTAASPGGSRDPFLPVPSLAPTCRADWS